MHLVRWLLHTFLPQAAWDTEGKLLPIDEINMLLGSDEVMAWTILAVVKDNFQWSYGAHGGAHRHADKSETFAKVTDASSKCAENTTRTTRRKLSTEVGHPVTCFHLQVENLKTLLGAAPPHYLSDGRAPGPDDPHSPYEITVGENEVLECKYVLSKRDDSLEAEHSEYYEANTLANPTSGRFHLLPAFPIAAWAYRTDSDGDACGMILDYATLLEAMPSDDKAVQVVGSCNDEETYTRDRRILHWVHMVRCACILEREVAQEATEADTDAAGQYAALVQEHATESTRIVNNLTRAPCTASSALALVGIEEVNETNARQLLARTVIMFLSNVETEPTRGLKYHGKSISCMKAPEAKAAFVLWGQTPLRTQPARVAVIARLVQAGIRARRRREQTPKERELAELTKLGFGAHNAFRKNEANLPRLEGIFNVPELWHCVFTLISCLTIGW